MPSLFLRLYYSIPMLLKKVRCRSSENFFAVLFSGGFGAWFFLSRLFMAFINDYEESASVSGCFRGLSFENSEHFFDGEFSAARHAVVSDFMVVKDFSGRAIRAVNALVFWFEHFLSLSF